MDPTFAAGWTLAATVMLSQLPHGSAIAYLDPGSGSLLIQALIAGAVTVPFVLRRRLSARIDRLRGRSARVEEPTQGRPAPR